MVPAWTTLICYVFMTMMSFYIGQKHFKINYDMGKIAKYFFIAISLFSLNGFLDVLGEYNNIQIDNTILFTIYIIFMYSQIRKLFKPITAQ